MRDLVRDQGDALLRLERRQERQPELEHTPAAETEDRPARVVFLVDDEQIRGLGVGRVGDLVDQAIQGRRLRAGDEVFVGDLPEPGSDDERDSDHQHPGGHREDLGWEQRDQEDAARKQNEREQMHAGRNHVRERLTRRHLRLEFVGCG